MKPYFSSDDLATPGENFSPEETRARLLDAAEEVFAEKGFDGATTREICARAGVKNIGAINYHFRNKERLYAEAVKHAMRTCVQGVPFPEWLPETSPLDKLRDFIRVMMARILEIPKAASMTLMTREITRVTPSPVTEEAVRENIRPMADLLVAILAELCPQLSFERRVLCGFSVIGQCLYYRQNRAVGHVLFGSNLMESFDIDILAQHIFEFTCAALGLGQGLIQQQQHAQGGQ